MLPRAERSAESTVLHPGLAFWAFASRDRPGGCDDVAFVKRILVGRPLATTEMEHQRIPKTIGLAVFSSDAISSTAYATEEILFVVAVGGSSLALGLSKLVPISLVVAGLLALVIRSYGQAILAYAGGGV